MRLAAWLLASVALGCAAGRQAQLAESRWRTVEVAELSADCLTAYLNAGLEPPRARAQCTCVVPRLTSLFSYAWFHDGQPMTRAERSRFDDVHASCALRLLEEEAMPRALHEPPPDRTARARL